MEIERDHSAAVLHDDGLRTCDLPVTGKHWSVAFDLKHQVGQAMVDPLRRQGVG